MGVAHVGEPTNDPLGACWECHVFGCKGHARRDTGSGKFLCFPTVAKALMAGAGLERIEPEIAIASSEDFERRFPDLASVTAQQRRTWAERKSTLANAVAVPYAAPADIRNWTLLADAVGVGVFLVGGARGFGDEAMESWSSIVGEPLAAIVREVSSEYRN
jgi:hypothetical protein